MKHGAKGILKGAVVGIAALTGISVGATQVIDRQRAAKDAQVPTYPENPPTHELGFYEKHVKRPQDFACALLATAALFPVMGITALLVKNKLGSPVIFKQKRPGKDGRIFEIMKFRTMTDERDADGNLLPDDDRMTSFGRMLRSTSLDELPELINILKGDMSLIGPRPQLVRDMVFMTPAQLKRHMVRPGLSGLAQVNGRNALEWDGRLAFDEEYAENVTFTGDWKLIGKTINKVFQRADVATEGMETSEDLGDWLLRTNQITDLEYKSRMESAQKRMGNEDSAEIISCFSINDCPIPAFSVLMSVYEKENPGYLSQAFESILHQTLRPDEIVLIEDGPLNKDLYDVIDTFSKSNPNLIKIVKLKENMGLGPALAEGILRCSNNLVARMDTDDISMPDRFEKQIACFMLNENLDICGSNISEFEESPNNIVAYRNVPTDHESIVNYQKKRDAFNHMSVMYKKDAVLKAGNYKSVPLMEDTMLWVNMIVSGSRCMNIPECLVNVRAGKEMIDRRGGWDYFKKYWVGRRAVKETGFISNKEYYETILIQFVVANIPRPIRRYIFTNLIHGRRKS